MSYGCGLWSDNEVMSFVYNNLEVFIQITHKKIQNTHSKLQTAHSKFKSFATNSNHS